jgi:hypothetical protein
MADQTITKLVGFIKDLRMYVHGIPYISTFTILYNIIVNSNYSMLFGRPWFKDAKITYYWENNMITIQGNGTIQTIFVTI